MARQLWLLRHAEAEPHGSREDAARRLTERGERQARAAGVAIAQLCAEFDAVLFSPNVRSTHTAMLASEAWEDPQRAALEEHAPLAGNCDAHQALDAMAGLGSECRVMLVGHEPDLSRLAGALTGARLDLK